MWDRLSVYLDNASLTVGLLQLRFYRSLEGFASFLSGRAYFAGYYLHLAVRRIQLDRF